MTRVGLAVTSVVAPSLTPTTSASVAHAGSPPPLIGNDPARWRTDFPTCAKVAYPPVYPGVGLTVYGNQRQLEYDFVVAADADPGAIRLADLLAMTTTSVALSP